MAKGKAIYFSVRELKALMEVLGEWKDKVDEDTYASYLEFGLGSAWRKLVEAKIKTEI